jgi:hypothetical protein
VDNTITILQTFGNHTCIFDDDLAIFFGFGSPHSGSVPQKYESGQCLSCSIGLEL